MLYRCHYTFINIINLGVFKFLTVHFSQAHYYIVFIPLIHCTPLLPRILRSMPCCSFWFASYMAA